MMLQLKENDGIFSIDVLTEYAPREGLASEQQTPLYWEGHLFGIMPKDGGSMRNQLVCVDPKDPQKNDLDKWNRKPFWTGSIFYCR